jgi:hypothetical protein
VRLWSLAAGGIYYLGPDGPAGPDLQFFDFASRETKVVARLEKRPHERIWEVEVSPDGQWILYGVSNAHLDIMLVENFR